MNLLLVDDSALIREKLEERLSKIDKVRVSTAGSVGEALDTIPRLNPDVVILDLHFPDGSGLDVLREIRKKDSHPVVIIFTQFGSPIHRKITLEEGADFFFEKTNGVNAVYDLLQWIARNEEKAFPSRRANLR